MMKYVLLTVEDALLLALCVIEGLPCDERQLRAYAVAKNLRGDTGGDLEQITDTLKGLPICVACRHESMDKHCESLTAQKTGRRISRLVERAKARRAGAATQAREGAKDEQAADAEG